MSKTQNVKPTKRSKTWILFALIALLLWYVTANVFVHFGAVVAAFGYALTICVAVLAVCLFFNKVSLVELFKETEEEKAAREERRERRREKRESKEDDDDVSAKVEPMDDVKVSGDVENESDGNSKEPEDESNDEDEEIQDEGDEVNASRFTGYRVGDVFVNVPVSCFNNFIGPASKAIKAGKIELSHGLILDDNNVVRISLNEMVKYGYKVPTGYRLNIGHDTLVPSANALKYDGNGRYKADTPDGFEMILEGECAGEFVPVSAELIANL